MRKVSLRSRKVRVLRDLVSHPLYSQQFLRNLNIYRAMLPYLLLLSFLVSITLASRGDPRYECIPGDLPPDPERCIQFLYDLMREPWTHERRFFSADSDGAAHIPAHYAEFGCLLEIFPFNDGSGASFALADHLHMLEEMINECFFRKREIGTMRISGVHSGVIVSLSGQGELTTQGNLTRVSGPNQSRNSTAATS